MVETRSNGSAPGSVRMAWVLVLTSTAFFMTALDTLVVVIALPRIQADLNVGLPDLQWTVNSYNIALAAGIVSSAALGDRFGRRRLFVLGLLLFVVASAVCALAPNVNLLIAARTVQGFGAAIIVPLSLTILICAFPINRRAAVIGVYGGLAGLAVATGPLLGGAVTEGLDWHWIFGFNVPIGIVAAVLSMRLLPESYGERTGIDLTGVALMTTGAISLVWAMTRATDIGWNSSGALSALVIGVLALAAFVWWEDRARTPLMPLRLLRIRAFSAGNAAAFLSWGSVSAGSFLATQYFQFALGYSPFETGVRLLPFFLTPLFFAPLAGGLAERFGVRRLVVLGLLLQSAGFGWVAVSASLHPSYPEVAIALLIAGAGVSMTLPTVPIAVLGTVEPAQTGMASGITNTMQRLGAVFGVAVATAVFSAYGSLASPAAVSSGFRLAIVVVGAGFALVGALSAILIDVRANVAPARQAVAA